MDVILVPGFLNRPSIMRGLVAHLSAAGHVCHVLPLEPSDGRHGIDADASRLAEFIRESGAAEHGFVIVGFSMGALIARCYLQTSEAAVRARAFFSIAGPHRGTWTAWLFPTRGVRQMRPGSSFLRQLALGSAAIEHIPTTSYWTPFDLMAFPAATALLPYGDRVRVPALLHTQLLFDARLHEDLGRRLAALGSLPR